MKFKEMSGDGVQATDLKRVGKAEPKVYVHKDGKTIMVPAEKKDEYMAKGYKLSSLRAEDDTSSKGMNKYGLAAKNKDGKFYSYRNGKLTGTFDNMADLQKHQHDLIKDESIQTEDLAQMAQKVEQDHEVQMARSDLYKAAKYSIKLHERLKGISEEEGLEGWVAAKITKASDYLSSVFHYMDYEMMSSEDMTESRTKIVQAIKTKSEQPEPTYKETISKKYQEKLDEVSKKKTEAVLEDFVGKPITEEEFEN